MNYNGSKRIAYFLRHDKDYSFEVGGWRAVSDLCLNHSFSLEDIINIVLHDDKGRFELNHDNTKVRALYGHSVKIDLQLKEEVPPKQLLHGTASKYIESIHRTGLTSCSRRFVHLTEDEDVAIKTGSRHGDPIVLVIDSQTMITDGYKFYHTDNGIWLTTEVPSQYIIH